MSVEIVPIHAVSVYEPTQAAPTGGIRAQKLGPALELRDPEGLVGGDTLNLDSWANVLSVSRVILLHADTIGTRIEIGLTQVPNSQQAAQRILFEPSFTDTSNVLHPAVVTVYDQFGTGNKRPMSLELFRSLFEVNGAFDTHA